MAETDRYQRQKQLPWFGCDGQTRLGGGKALIVGCGGLGSVIADALARAGVGHLMIVDRDVVELTNLHRQVLFDEDDAVRGVSKAEAARRRVAEVNSDVRVSVIVDDFNGGNAREYGAGCDVIVDGTDNFETRFIINDLAVSEGVPYVYGGAVGMAGSVCSVLPRTKDGDSMWEREGVVTPCLRCMPGELEGVGEGVTCETVGVLGPVVSLVASYQAVEAIKILARRFDCVDTAIRSFDLSGNTQGRIEVCGAFDDECSCCVGRKFDYLDGLLG